nr:hypothetical protein [Deltaproteobacteria bacterium]
MRGTLGLAIAIAFWWCARVASAHPVIDKPCKACHPDVHHAEFAARDGGDCKGCHAITSWTPATFGAAQHATTKYVLDGKHVGTPCSGCHPAGASKPRSFLVAQAECLDCHENPHGLQFAARQANGGCAGCHTTTAWKQWKVDHKVWPLADAHARAACASCHPGKGIDAPIAAFRGIAKTCKGCHVDIHAQQFTLTAPAKDCASCHGTNRWETPKFDHVKTRYALDGVHVDLACASCHRPTKLRNDDRVITWRLGYAECKDCHANPHPKVGMDCKGCHAATSWKPTARGGAGFDHDATGFGLRAAHAKAACTQCHTGTRSLANNTCQSCHPDPHLGRMAGQCFECHTAVAWQDVGMFDQHRRTRMPLTGKHAVIECSACHKRQAERTWRDLPTDCFGCHAQSYQTAKTPDHDPPGGPLLPRDCARCHVTTGWAPAIDPAKVTRLAATEHDRVFALSTGSHRTATCESCHVDRARTRAVRCDGCHTPSTLRAQHRQPVTPIASACLR